MAQDIKPLSGFRDILAEGSIPRQKMIEIIRGVYEKYGLVPLETPAVERFETLTGKYGAEGDKLIYRLAKRGDEEGETLALRYDLTVPLARIVAQYKDKLPMPYKRYQFGNVWRGDRPQAGRYREFMQFDADIVGTDSYVSDAEIVAMISETMTALGVRAVVRINNRLILDALAEKSQLESDSDKKVLIGTIDKVEKIGLEKAVFEIESKLGANIAKLVRNYLEVKGTTSEKLELIEKLLENTTTIAKGIENMNHVFDTLETMGFGPDKVVFDNTIARGLDYYTGIIYETQLVDLPSIGSVCSGGRYDKLVASLGGPDLPAVGTSIGFDRLFTALEELKKVAAIQTKTKVLIANFGGESLKYQIEALSKLRSAGIGSEMYYEPDKMAKQFKFADKLGVPIVLIFGPEEISKNLVTIKNLKTREQKIIPVSEMLEVVKSII